MSLRDLDMYYLDTALHGDLDSLRRSFTWRSSEEGDDFWQDLYTKGMTPTGFYHLLEIRKKYSTDPLSIKKSHATF